MTHLEQVRAVKRMRTIGKPWKAAAEHVGVSIPTARKLYAEYWERHKAGTLFEDRQETEEDLYAVMSIPTRRVANA